MEQFVRSAFGGAKLFLVDQTLVRAGGHYLTYNRSLMDAARELGLDPWILAGNMLEPELSVMPNVMPVFSGSWHTPHNPVAPLAPHDSTAPQTLPFASELMLALHRLGAKRADHVFIHTIGFYEVVELHRALLQADMKSLPRFHILCRRDLDEAPVGSEGRIAFEYAIQGLCRLSTIGLEVRFYTDTPELSEHYSAHTGVRFVTLPIPFGIDVLQAALTTHAGERGSRSTTQLCYLGDARDEKGYQHIPAAIDGLPADLRKGQVTFVLQSNFNTPGGEPQVARARARLQTMPRALVDLRQKPLTDPEYFDVLASSDAAFIAYNDVHYARRSSGVFTEALYAGVIPIVPAGTSMAAQLPTGFPSIYQNVLELPGIIADIHRRKQELKEQIARLTARWRELHSPKQLLLQLLCAPPPALLMQGEKLSRDEFDYGVQVRERPHDAAVDARPLVAMHVVDLESLYWRIGAGYVKRLQAEALVGQGVQTFAVMVVHKVLDENASDLLLRPSYWSRQAAEVARELGYAGHWVVYRRANLETRPPGLLGEMAERAMVMSNEGLSKFLSHTTPDFVYSNYAQNHPTLQRCGLASLPIIVETHDVQAHQAALYDKSAQVDEDAAAELAVYARVSAISCLTEPDALYMRENGMAAVESCLPLIQPRQVNDSIFAGLQDLGELLSASGSREATVDIEKAWATGQTAQLIRLFSETRMNMLFVGGWHKPNIEGLQWFYDKVFRPYLEPAGKNAFVFGGIFPEKARAPSDRIFWAGLCDSLDLAYAAAEIVVAPLLQGTGVNIKVLEALAWGKPIVATSVALRGISGAKEALGAYDEPEAFARRVLALSEKPVLRQEASRKAREVYRALLAQNDYSQHVSRLVAHAVPSASLPMVVPARSVLVEQERPATEWTMRRTHLARYVRHILEGNMDADAFSVLIENVAAACDLADLAEELTALYETAAAEALNDNFLGSRLSFPRENRPESARQALRWLLLRANEQAYSSFNAELALASAGSRTVGDVVSLAATPAGIKRMRTFEKQVVSGVGQQLQAHGFDFVIWNGHRGVGEVFTSWLVREVIAADPALRDASILIVGGRASTAFADLNIVHLDDADNIDPLAVVGRTLILPAQGINVTHPHWLRAALVFTAAGRRVLGVDLGFACEDIADFSLAQDATAWTGALIDALAENGSARISSGDIVSSNELREMAPVLGSYLSGLAQLDLAWSPAHSALGVALGALVGEAGLTQRQERELRQREQDERFAGLAAVQIESWLERSSTRRAATISAAQMSHLAIEPALGALLSVLAEAAKTDWVKPRRRPTRLAAAESPEISDDENAAPDGENV